MKGKEFLSNVSTSSGLHVLSVLIVHLCFVSANFFHIFKNQKKTKHLAEAASAAQVIFVSNFLLLVAF